MWVSNPTASINLLIQLTMQLLESNLPDNLNPHRSVAEFFATNLMSLPRGDWRLTDYVLGEINGLPKSRGRVVATNGIMCYIQQEYGLYYGHYTSWTPDHKEPVIRQGGRGIKSPTAKKIAIVFEGF